MTDTHGGPLSRRYLDEHDTRSFTPVHAVWELTLACDLKCRHCGSRAGTRRRDELNLEECRQLIGELASLGVRHITLIGGEAYLRPDWTAIIAAIRSAGIDCTLQTGGLHLDAAKLREAAAAGLQGVGFSIDGLEEVHDRLRGVRGSFRAVLDGFARARAANLDVSANTQISAPVVPELRDVYELLVAHEVTHWQVQLTVAMGRAADNPDLLLQPYQLLHVMPLLADLYRDGLIRGLLLEPGNNIGYFGPFEALWRGHGDTRVHWTGCNAGQNTIGIEADGTIKGCPSLPNAYAGGKVRSRTVQEIWQTPALAFAREGLQAYLWGFCRDCRYADVCGGGCTWTSHSLFGRPGNNPYCHHRVLELARQGLRERVTRVQAPPGESFDHGLFELTVEALSGGPAIRTETPRPAHTVVPLVWRRQSREGALQTLAPCPACQRHIGIDVERCSYCGADVRAATLARRKTVRRARAAQRRLSALLAVDE
jgi:radical SAM protein with 4Fe4S-binding SPASM domain